MAREELDAAYAAAKEKVAKLRSELAAAERECTACRAAICDVIVREALGESLRCKVDFRGHYEAIYVAPAARKDYYVVRSLKTDRMVEVAWYGLSTMDGKSVVSCLV